MATGLIPEIEAPTRRNRPFANEAFMNEAFANEAFMNEAFVNEAFMNEAFTIETVATTPFRTFLHKNFYFSMALLCVAIKVVSVLHTSAPSVIEIHHDGVFHPERDRPLFLLIHNFVFAAWLLFFAFQAGLVHLHKVKWHRFFGWFGGALGVAVAIAGVATAIAKGRAGIADHMGTEAEAYLIVPIYNILVFSMFCALIVAWRKKPELHREMIFFATCGLLDTAFMRFDFIFNHHAFYLCIDLLILLGVLRDLYVFRRVQKAYLIVLPALFASQAFVYYTWSVSSDWSVRIARAIIG